MKKFLIGTFALFMAVAAVFATKPAPSSDQSLYWFRVVNGAVQPSATQPTQLEASEEPFGCNDEIPILCARGYTAYQLIDGMYHPDGTNVENVNKQDSK